MTEEDAEPRVSDPSGIAMSFGPFRLLRSQRLLLEGSRAVPMSSRAMDILLALVEQPGKVLTHGDLITRAWPGATVEDVNLRVHVSALRRALGDSSDGQPYLVTVPGRGYRFVGALASAPAPMVPPIAAIARPATLPLPLARIIGRVEVVDRIRSQLAQRHLVTIVGPGGIGKTTVATAVADGIAASYPDGVQWIDLATLDRDETVPATIAFALGLANFSTDPSPGVAAALRDKRMLLILDSCERVVMGAARMVERIRQSARGVHILATSREPLRVGGEHVVRLPPLGLPPEPDVLTVAQALEYPAVQLFVERASATVDGFALTEANLPLVARICSRLDGIALAIELAAGHLAAFELQSLAALLDERLRLMAAGRRTALPRHRTMQAALEWSYETLPEQERLVLRRLAVFGGSTTLPAIREVAADATLDQESVVASLVRLVDKSLVAAEISEAGVRYRLLDTTRAYALEKLAATGELAATARRHAEYYQRQLQNMGDDGDLGQGEYSADLAADVANVRTALDWAISADGDQVIHVALTIASVPLWMQLSQLGECRARVNQALQALDRDTVSEPRSEMALRSALGMSLMYTSGPVDESDAIWQRVLDLAVGLRDTEYQLRSLYGLWLYNILVCRYRTGLTLAQQFQRVAAQSTDTSDISTAERMAAMALHYLGDQAGTRAAAERSLDAPVPTSRRFHTTHYGLDQRVGAYVLLARSLWLQGLPEQAIKAAQAGVDEAENVGHANSLCVALADGASLVAILTGDVVAAGHFAAMLTEHAEKHALGVWRTYGLALHGRLLAQESSAADGAVLLRSALADLRGTPFDIRYQLYLIWLAEALGTAAQATEALMAIDEAIDRAEGTEERWYFPELLRIRGELLIQQALPDGRDAADDCFVRSLGWAQQQGVLSWELRTTLSRARLQLVKPPELGSVLSRFGEGFGTADLMAAKRLLAEWGY
jgi:predicted ATPase/DNA-binding winged helix-turn-helix (wHTH) protein